MARGLADAQPPCSAKFANAPPPGLTRQANAPQLSGWGVGGGGGGWAQVELTDAVQKRQTGSLFKLSIHEWNLDLPGLTVIPPSETWELFWAIFAFTTLFSSWNVVLQPIFFYTAFGTERSQRAFTSKLNSLLFARVKYMYDSSS